MIKLPKWVGGSDEEYETQHFGFGAQRLKISVRQMVDQKIRTGVKDMETYLAQTLDLNDTDKETLTQSCDNLIRLYCQRAEPSLDIVDKEIERILKVPENVLLPEDEVQRDQISTEEYNKLKEDVVTLRRRVERAALLEAFLTAEEEELAMVENVCEIAKKDMEVLDLLQKDIDSKENVKKIQNNVQFLCASAPFMVKSDEVDLYEDKTE
ncbi:protein MIS12 homolog [Aricia agestis]|uniref:protein MIS12 homolog n=1 Tax=Aricia agestis TaxID=91739 RepID=UPI001C204C64|nr:protein MIS12 homolog [Aricia agestis]